jgi:hypothetical protein
MPIRTPSRPASNAPNQSTPQLRKLEAKLAECISVGPGKATHLAETEARALIKQAKSENAKTLNLFKDTMSDVLRSGKFNGQVVEVSADTLAMLSKFTGIPESQTSPILRGDGLSLQSPEDLSNAKRKKVSRGAAERLLGVAAKHKGVEGTGQESSAKGDPKITSRRGAIGTLLADKTGALDLDMLAGLSPQIANDIKWIKAAERSDYSVDGTDKQFSWAKSEMSGSKKIMAEFKRRVAAGKKQASQLEGGTQKAFNAADGSVFGISQITDPEQRTAALVDTLLQFRARTDKANQKEQTWGATTTRADLIGPTLIAEQRMLLASADLSLDDPVKLREYALLREVISSHPTSSVNGIFEARNAVGKIFMDGASNYSGKDHATAWIKEETPPGATASAYKSIHHNFSRDTPGNIRAMIDQWVFPLGDQERRGPLFVQVVSAMNQARAGQGKEALKALQELDPADRKAIKPLLQKLDGVAPGKVADAILGFLEDTSVKPLSSSIKDQLQKELESAKKADASTYSSSYAYKSIRNRLKAISGPAKKGLKPLLDKLDSTDDKKLSGLIESFLKDNESTRFPNNAEQNLDYFSRLFRSVCAEQPSAQTLERDLFKAGDAWPEVADVIAQLRAGNDVSALKDLGEARIALRSSIVGAKTGYERQELIKFDAQISRLTNTELGATVDRVGSLNTDAHKAEALIGVQTALRSAVAGGLHAIKDPNDPASTKGQPLDVVLESVNQALSSGKVDESEYRALMSEVYVSVARTVQNIRAFVDSRSADVASLGAELDPEFLDQFVKQSPLHYATALSEKGMRAGLKEEIGPRRVANVEGMRVLNSVGPVVFSTIVTAENTKELVKLKPPKDAMSVLYGLEEKKMVAVGGLIVDTDDAPGGNSHLNMYAMNNGITVLALPELRTKYADLLKNAANEGGLYVDDSNGEFQMMTVEYAKEQGIITDADLPNLRPGTNKKISYLKSKGLQDGFEVIGRHDAIVSPNRVTRNVELFIPMEEVNGIGRKCTSFEELATLGIHGRHLAGEKGTVLALLRSHPALGKNVPDGSMVTTGRCRLLLKEAGILDQWDDVWKNDPEVGVVDDDNFLKSRFYSDPSFRAETREHLQELTKTKLSELLVTKDANGKEMLTPAGETLYAELQANPSLKESDNWITRSSFTGEDRPGKSGAGQYESFFHLKDPVSRIKGVIGVMESTWMPEPIENNVADEVNLQRIMPAVVVQHCLKPQHSGVMISRDIEHGTRGQVYYQLVKGFGGGVEGGKTEEGTIASSGHRVKVSYPGEDDGLVPADALKELRGLVLETEKYFNDVVEKGSGYAVDMEVARVDGEWNIVQARVIQLDR